MLIRNIRKKEDENLCFLVADVIYEDNPIPPKELYFAVPQSINHYLEENGECFLLGVAAAARFHGERRIHVESLLCPLLVDNLKVALRLQKMWFGGASEIPQISASNFKAEVIDKSEGKVSGSFLSGGVDSLATLKQNHGFFPAGHPDRIKSCILVYGLDIGDPNKRPRPDLFSETINRLEIICQEKDCELIPVYTNIRDVEPNSQFYAEQHFASVLSAIAHALIGRLHRCYLGLDFAIEYAYQHGSHPLLNQYYNSNSLQVVSMLSGYTRLERTEMIKNWQTALDSLRVCYTTNDIRDGQINCGRCEKCLRTKLALLATGSLERAGAFPDKEIPPNAIRSKVSITKLWKLDYYIDLLARLNSLGYGELASAIKEAIYPSFYSLIVRKIRTFLTSLKNLIRKARNKTLHWKL